MHASGRTGASRTSDLFFFSLPRASLGFSPFSTLCIASLELNWRYTTHIGNIYHSHTCTKFIQYNCTNMTLSLIVGCKHGREKVRSYRHYAGITSAISMSVCFAYETIFANTKNKHAAYTFEILNYFAIAIFCKIFLLIPKFWSAKF